MATDGGAAKGCRSQASGSHTTRTRPPAFANQGWASVWSERPVEGGVEMLRGCGRATAQSRAFVPLSPPPQASRRMAVLFDGEGALRAASKGAPGSFQVAPAPYPTKSTIDAAEGAVPARGVLLEHRATLPSVDDIAIEPSTSACGSWTDWGDGSAEPLACRTSR